MTIVPHPPGMFGVPTVIRHSIVTGTGNASGLILSHPLSTANRRVVVVASHARGTGSLADTTNVIYNGTNMNGFGALAAGDDRSSLYIYYLLNASLPAGGSNYNVEIVTLPTSLAALEVGVVEFSNVDQSTPFGTIDMVAQISTSVSRNITTLINDLVFSSVALANGGPAITIPPEQVPLWDISYAGSTRLAGSTEHAVTTSVNKSYSWAGSIHNVFAGFLIRPFK